MMPLRGYDGSLLGPFERFSVKAERTMSRYVEHASNLLGATIVHAMWNDALTHAQMISSDATGALIQPAKTKDG